MQTGFEFTYKQGVDIITAIEKISQFSILEFSILGSIIIFIFIGVYYLFPITYLTKKFYDREHEKAKRKLMLKQISTQREIEDEIEAEIEVTTQARAEENK